MSPTIKDVTDVGGPQGGERRSIPVCEPAPMDEVPKPAGADHKHDVERFTAAALDAVDFAALDIPKPRRLLGDGVLTAGAFGILHGKPGLGKTWVALELARALVRGTPWFGLGTAAEGVRVGFLELELGAYDTQERLAALGLGQNPRDRSLSLVARPMLNGAVDLFANLSDLAALRHWIVNHGLEVLVLDALSRAHTANENSAEDFGLVLSALDALRHDTGCAILLVHHERKSQDGGRGKDDDQDAMRGTSRLQSDPTLQIRIKRVTNDIRCIVFVKVNTGPTPEPIYYRLREDGTPEVVDAPAKIGTENRERLLRVILDAAGPLGWADVRQIAPKADGTLLSKSTVCDHLKALEEEGRIVVTEGRRKQKTYSPLSDRPGLSEQAKSDSESALFHNELDEELHALSD